MSTRDHAGRDFRDQVEWRHIEPEELLALLLARKRINTELQFTGQATVETFDFRRVLTVRTSVAELAGLTDRYDNQLFERNIRRYLGLAGNRVNEAVAATLRSRDQRSNFYFYNNGITITCSQFRHNALQRENWSVQVNDLQIVNGGQTARTVQQIARELGAEIAQNERARRADWAEFAPELRSKVMRVGIVDEVEWQACLNRMLFCTRPRRWATNVIDTPAPMESARVK